MQWSLPSRGSAVTIGVYDGVHRGHQRVIADLETMGVSLGARRRVVLTFDCHPVAVLEPTRAPKMLTTMERRLDILESLGVDVAGVLPFDQIRQMRPEEFIRRVLVDALHARLVVVGSNFRFGVDRSGGVDTLRSAGARFGFEVDAVDLLRGDGATLSSTAIRRMLNRGEVEAAANALGRLFELPGTVTVGDGRGIGLGYPTANLDIPKELLIPADGVYAVWATVRKRTHPAVANIGVRPTFEGAGRVVEAHLLDVAPTLYGEPMTLQFVGRIRDEQQFAGADELVTQIELDVAKARAMLEES
ncbi:MAG: bifunctional riboflavin kinase/FAD synthetase [Gammaproteobacteria bacterium]|nr:bifunctional riboflavin kinase/FAD synthetase [Gammaproteobacteria bacterium]